jgi:glycerol-3-phosphate dehydrogenase
LMQEFWLKRSWRRVWISGNCNQEQKNKPPESALAIGCGSMEEATMFTVGWRERIWERLDEPWDVLIIGGGITGAGVLNLAARAGYKALLVDAGDFASGTSSRSSKLVHGGLRYLYNRQFNVTRESVKEREWMLREGRGLVQPLPFLLPNFERYHKSGWEFRIGVLLYDLMALKWKHRGLSHNQMMRECPVMQPIGLNGGCEYSDAKVDDARLVLRVLMDGCRQGGAALNYTRVIEIQRDLSGKVRGVIIQDEAGFESRQVEVQAKVLVNASGPWADDVRGMIGAGSLLRKQRGSHIVFPNNRLPLEKAVTMFHPRDHRALFAIPWEGVTLIGTTDIDHDPREFEVLGEPYASPAEITYLLEAADTLFPSQNLGQDEILSTFAGIRPIIKSGAANPSKESRAHAVWVEDGMVTITGGKLTTFRIMARQVMEKIGSILPNGNILRGAPIFNDEKMCLDVVPSKEMIPGTSYAWSQMERAACSEGIIHLDDLLLRRVRLGVICPGGGQDNLPQIRSICQRLLGWSDARWIWEEERYRMIWYAAYSPEPGSSSIMKADSNKIMRIDTMAM